MKLQKRFFLLLLLSLVSTNFSLKSSFAQTQEAASKATADVTLDDGGAADRKTRLDRGDIIATGGYLKKGVWGKMEGVVEASPKVVWNLYLHVDHWKADGFPNLIDGRGVSDSAASQLKGVKKIDDFYKILGKDFISPFEHQQRNAIWINYTLQYYDLPWPVVDKWMVLKNTNDETRSAEGIYHSEWVNVGGNVNTSVGRIEMKPYEGNPRRTLLEYQVVGDPGGFVPKFILKWGVKKTMPSVMRVIRRSAAQAIMKPAPLLKIQ